LTPVHLQVTPGLSSYAPYGDGAGEALQPLLEFAAQQVPADVRATTPLHLMATAGLRMLSANQSEAVLGKVREAMSKAGFLFRCAHSGVLRAQGACIGASHGMHPQPPTL
jgi:Golgi nucleoside diphosphatase